MNRSRSEHGAKFDPIQVEVWRHLFASIAEEMGAALERTGFSPNIKERRDHSCAIFDSSGRLLAQAAHIPVHLGAMPLMMDKLVNGVKWSPGTMWLTNDPRHGGTHLPDFTLVSPIYESRPRSSLASRPNLVGFVANRAHHADIGGLAPGSLPLSTEIYHEGLIIPPVRLVSRNRMNADVLALICANSRTPYERRGDLAAQISANRTGASRFLDLISRHGMEEIDKCAEEARAYSETFVRNALFKAPEGEFSNTDYLDDDGAGNYDLPITVKARIRRGEIEFDFFGTAPETAGSVNATEAVTRSACYYVVRCLIDEDIPMNDGAFAPIRVIAPPGTLVNASHSRAVAAGNVETSQRIVDVVLGALAQAFPDRIPAASQGTMNNLLIGGEDPNRGGAFAYYETICGGSGGSPHSPGASAIHSHMTNTRNTPIEALELHYPLRVTEYAIREQSGGSGENPGGEGVVRSVQLLAPAHVSVISERRRHAPPGAGSGSAGERGCNSIEDPDGVVSELNGKASVICEAGTVVTIETPGGGGWSPL